MKKLKLWVVLAICSTTMLLTSCNKEDENDNNNQNNYKETVYPVSEYQTKLFGEWEITEIRSEYISSTDVSGTNNGGEPYSYKKGDSVKSYWYKKGWKHLYLDTILLFDNNYKWGSCQDQYYRGTYNINENTLNITLTNSNAKGNIYYNKYTQRENHFYNYTQVNDYGSSWDTPSELENGNQWKYTIEYLSDKKLILKYTYNTFHQNGTLFTTYSMYYTYQNKTNTATGGNMHLTD